MTLQRIKIKISGKKNKLRIMSFCTTRVCVISLPRFVHCFGVLPAKIRQIKHKLAFY